MIEVPFNFCSEFPEEKQDQRSLDSCDFYFYIGSIWPLIAPKFGIITKSKKVKIKKELQMHH